jgi:hypothetical protein
MGVFSTRFIPKGTMTWTIDALDRKFAPSEFAALDVALREIVEKYSHRDRLGRHVLCWDHARFVNHDSAPNCLLTAYEFEIAIRDIQPGEQLTDDYGCLNISQAFQCETPGGGRSLVRPDDMLRHHVEWDRVLSDAFARFGAVEQPLARFLSPGRRAQAEAVARGEAEMESVLTCYFHG